MGKHHNTKKQETLEKEVAKPQMNLTPEEAAVVSRIQAEDSNWKEVSEKDTLDYSLAEDPFKLPSAAKKLQDERKFRFRWIERTKERIDQIRTLDVPRRWWIVNGDQIPELADQVDPVLGCITKLDQLLVFKPYWMYDKETEMKTRMADSKDTAGNVDNKHGVPVDESGSEFVAGKQARVSGADVVELHETGDESEPAFVEGDAPDSGDID